MTTIKSFTDLEQSKKLAEILPIESADMFWIHVEREGFNDWWKVETIQRSFIRRSMNILCWSLAALLGTLAENKICHYDDRYYCQYMSKGDEFPIYSTAEYDNPIDACYEMILKLHELKML